MLHLVHGNRFEELAAELADDLAAARRGGASDLYTPVVIAVPGGLVAGGLRLALARRLTIAANLRFPSLEALLAEIVLRARPDWLVLERRMLQSLLVALLGDDERLDGDELAPVRRYVAAGAAREVRRVQLAGELARLFMDYALTRPEMVAGWSRGEGETWQPRLWREVAGAGARAAERLGRTRAGLVAQLVAELPAGDLASGGPLHLFGFSYLARGYRPLLARLARAAEVRIYSPNPCREFWEDAGDGPDDNPILAAWGRPAREHVAALNELDVGRFTERFAEPAAASALGRLQRDVLERAGRRTAADRPAASGDSSVRVLACPGVRRELEVIGGAITSMLAADPTLRLSDIAILLAPDGCERYQAQIGAVFDELGGIAHRRLELPLAGESRVVQAVEALLDLPLGRFTRAELLGLMVHPAVLARFPDVDREDWVRWCDELGIVHGADRGDHQGTYIDGDVYNWDQGLRRLALGSFMDVGERPVSVRLGAQAYVPARVAADERRSAARFALLARTLLGAARDQRERARPLAEWAHDLDRLVAAHIAAAERDDEKVLERVRQSIRDLADLDLDGRPVDHATARELLREGMDGLRSPGGELPTDAVLVAPLEPMRALPCRVLFIAGLGAGLFPAGERPSSLDLRAGEPRRAGDVSPRDRDRQAFLEAVLAARERLVVSYVARDEETGEELEPSPLVHELTEVLAEGYLAAEEAARLIERPPLRRWVAGRDPVSLRQASCAELRRDLVRHLGGAAPDEAELERELAGRDEVARALGLATGGAGEERGLGRLARATRAEPLVLTLAAVRRFLECPLQAWASAVLGVRGAEEEDLVAVSVEPFERDLLAMSASLRGVFLAHLAQGGGMDALERLHREAARRAEQDGRAPTGPFARGAVLRGMRVLTSWRGALEQAAGRMPRAEVIGFGAVREGEVVSRLEPPIEIEVAGRPVLLTGRTEPVADDGAIGSIVLVTGKDWSPRHWLRGAMDAVALAAAGGGEERAHAMTLATGTGKLERVALPRLDREAARGYLASLVEELFAAPHDYLLPCEVSLPQALGTAKGALADEVARLVDKKDGFFSSRGGPLRLPRHVAPPPDAEAQAMIARRFRLWVSP